MEFTILIKQLKKVFNLFNYISNQGNSEIKDFIVKTWLHIVVVIDKQIS